MQLRGVACVIFLLLSTNADSWPGAMRAKHRVLWQEQLSWPAESKKSYMGKVPVRCFSEDKEELLSLRNGTGMFQAGAVMSRKVRFKVTGT